MSSPRIAPVDQPYDAPIAEIFERMMPPGMEPLRLFRTQARNPRVLERMFAGHLLGKGTLSLRERELVILRTCARCGSEYEWGVHVALFAQRAELGKETIAATLAEPSQYWADDTDAMLFNAVDQLHDTSSIGEETWKTLSRVCADDKILEIIALVGYYHTIAFITNAAQVELETFAPRFADYFDCAGASSS